jgi:hypothetical protein
MYGLDLMKRGLMSKTTFMLVPDAPRTLKEVRLAGTIAANCTDKALKCPL